MLINKVCKNCKLTKKAIKYYVEQKLVQPEKKTDIAIFLLMILKD